jgi:branched-chain amino acid transport system substrate-binding protein
MAKQIKQLGLKAPLMGGETMNTEKFVELAGDSAEGDYASTPGAALEKQPRGPEFASKYKQRFKQDVRLYAPYFYDGVMVLAEAMKQADSTDPKKYLPALKTIKYDGVTGVIQFTDNGDMKNSLLSMYQVKNGKWVLLESYQSSTD